jgi:hypothetical protein
MEFDAQGSETKRTFRRVGAGSDAVLACLQKLAADPVKIPPQGKPMTVTVTLLVPQPKPP